MSPEKDRKTYLLGGVGVSRRIKSLNQRYIPKGGHLVDFATRTLPKRAILDASSDNTTKTPGSDQRSSMTFMEDVPGSEKKTSIKTLQLRKSTESAVNNAAHRASYPSNERDSNELRTRQRQWRPPGKAGALATTTSTRNKRSPSQTNQPRDNSPCTHCSQACEKIKKEMELEMQSVKQDKAHASQLRGKLEVALATALREKKEFEEYKAYETDKIRQEASEVSRKVHRDRMAIEARQRSALQQQAAWEKEKADIQALQSKLEERQREHSALKLQYKIEKEMLEKKIEQLESINAELQRTLDTRHQPGTTKSDHCLDDDEEEEDHAQTITACTPALSSSFSSTTAASSQAGSCHADAMHSPSISRPSTSASDITTNTTSLFLANDYSSPRNSNACINMQPLHVKKTASPSIKRFENGTVQYIFHSGHAITYYTNGDIKQEYPTGIIEYLFKSVDCWQVTHPSSLSSSQGIDVFYFPSGQVEAHLPGDIKEIFLPGSGQAFKSWPHSDNGGAQVAVSPSLLCKEILWPKPSILNIAQSV